MEPMKPMSPMKPMAPMKPMSSAEPWWPSDLGEPSSTGSQNGMRYAFFSEARRLFVEQGGDRKTYDSRDHRISGVAQQDGTERTLTFSDQNGSVSLDDLKLIA